MFYKRYVDLYFGVDTFVYKFLKSERGWGWILLELLDGENWLGLVLVEIFFYFILWSYFLFGV